MNREQQRSRRQRYLVGLADVAERIDADHTHHDTGTEIGLSREAHDARLSRSCTRSLRVLCWPGLHILHATAPVQTLVLAAS